MLAPCWADPQYYPSNCATVVQDTGYRLSKINGELDAIKTQNIDVFCFQEMTDEMFAAIKQMLGRDYRGYMAYHNSSYWSSYQQNPSNPVANGNATFINTKKWNVLTAQDVGTYPSDGSGNHAMYTQMRLKSGSPRIFHIMNFHLDSDTGKRKQELEGGLALMAPSFSLPGHTQAVVGDLNTTSSGSSIKQPLDSNGFVNLTNPLEPTHPFTDGYNGNNNYAYIDHILVRNGGISQGAQPRNHGLWVSYPVLTPDTNNPGRILANFAACGSDHFSVVGTLNGAA